MVNLHLSAESLCLLILYKDIENNSINRRMISWSDLHLGGFRSIRGCSDKAGKARYSLSSSTCFTDSHTGWYVHQVLDYYLRCPL